MTFEPQFAGLAFGIGLVGISNFVVVLWHFVWRSCGLAKPVNIRLHNDRIPDFDWSKNLKKHLTSYEGYILLVGYLSTVWYMNLLPNSYYDFESDVNWMDVVWQLVFVDFFGYVVHILEHYFLKFYAKSHKPHHVYVHPKLLDAFSGSLTDTALLILIPLYLTSRCVYWTNTRGWAYFGAAYSSWFMLIHSEVRQPLDPLFQLLGLGTPADHSVHHCIVNKNYAHFFTWFDRFFGTYRHPDTVMINFVKGA